MIAYIDKNLDGFPQPKLGNNNQVSHERLLLVICFAYCYQICARTTVRQLILQIDNLEANWEVVFHIKI